ncbi:hypothetical protein ARMSODRAFT_1027314 [Armillaria solidipes]|uniref:Uncharacterized protein n=1 Tax=Armillaria solidipes TaxID=1076256 RepID=A0A2H3AXH3_9AGAR|nr:hypothetical protein ARMSODRAFT_1027314 [Armillaria solidipes]
MRFGDPSFPVSLSSEVKVCAFVHITQLLKNRTRSSSSTFGLHHVVDDVYEDDGTDEISLISSSEEDPEPSTSSSSSKVLSESEQRQMEEVVASIRSRARHNDPYENWERNVRQESFRITWKNPLPSRSFKFMTLKTMLSDDKWNCLKRNMQKNSAPLTRNCPNGDAAIALDAGKVKKQMEEEQRIHDGEQKKVREAELKRRVEDEKKRAEEEKKRQEVEAEKREKEKVEQKESEETERVEAEKKATQEKLEAQKGTREQLGMSTADRDWREALETEVLSVAKNKHGISAEDLGYLPRRQITPKMGQSTHDEATINRISTQLVQILLPPQGHHPVIYATILSTLAKAAETEVTAEKKSVYPLSKVAFNLLETLEGFG